MSPKIERKIGMRVAQVVLYLVTLVFLARTLIAGWGEISAFEWNWSPLHLLVTAALLIFCSFSQGLLWTWLARKSGARLTFPRGAQAYVLSHLARYIPGGVWPFAQMAVTARNAGSSPVLFSGLLIVLQISVATVCVLLALPLVPRLVGFSADPRAAVLVAGLAVLVLVSPWLIKRVLDRLARWKPFSSLTVAEEGLTTGSHFGLFVGLLLLQILSSLAFVVFVAAQVELDSRGALYLIAAWNAAWLGGFLAIPVPMGLGVRESLLALLLSPLMPTALGAAVALLYRLFTVGTELIMLALAGALGAGTDKSSS